ncbi:hypothetical protein HK102_008197 [Quaeritorhiza haematococci]|nr:hypothetical protein HK102_008197 [Quaeritorhiza haematococci]
MAHQHIIEGTHQQIIQRTVAQTQQLISTKSVEEYMTILHGQIRDTTSTLYECLDALAEEMRNTERWRVRYEKTKMKLETKGDAPGSPTVRTQYIGRRSPHSPVYGWTNNTARAVIDDSLTKRKQYFVNVLLPMVEKHLKDLNINGHTNVPGRRSDQHNRPKYIPPDE